MKLTIFFSELYEPGYTQFYSFELDMTYTLCKRALSIVSSIFRTKIIPMNAFHPLFQRLLSQLNKLFPQLSFPKVQELMLFRKFGCCLFFIYCPTFCRQIFKWAANFRAWITDQPIGVVINEAAGVIVWFITSSVFALAFFLAGVLNVEWPDLVKAQNLLLIRKFVSIMKGRKSKIVNSQIFEKASKLGP